MRYLLFSFIFIFSYLAAASIGKSSDLGWQQIKPSVIIAQQTGTINSLDISPDDTMLVTGSSKGECTLWDLAGNTLHTLSEKSEFQTFSCSFNHDGSRVLSFYGEKDLHQSYKYLATKACLWDKQGKEVSNLNSNDSFIKFIDFTADAKNILVFYLENTASLFDDNGNKLQTINADFSSLFKVDINPDGNEFFLRNGYNNFNHQLWNLAKNEMAPLSGFTIAVIGALFIPHTNKLIVVLANHEAIEWDYVNNTKRKLQGNYWNWQLSISPKLDMLISYGQGYDPIDLLNLEGNKLGSLKKVFYIHKDLPLFSPDGSRLVAPYSDEVMVIWNYSTNEKRFLIGHEDRIKSVGFSPNGQYIVTASKDKTAMVWNLKGDLLFILYGHEHNLKDAFFTLDSKQVITYDKKNVMIWDIPSLPN